MLGVYDFCGHYEWTFAWLQKQGGPSLLRAYWDIAIAQDSQQHAHIILEKGIEGMKEYWGHTLQHENAVYHTASTDKVFRIDMHECPSKGFLLRNNLEQHHDYCDHCMGWIGPLLKRGGYVIDHEHNHMGQCWWEIRSASDPAPASRPGELATSQDVRLRQDWKEQANQLDAYVRANDPDDKKGRI
jgi:hypothetical protein